MNKSKLLKKQLIIVIASAIALAALATLYFTVIRPYVNAREEAELPMLLEGESLGTSNRILVFDPIEKEDISLIEIHNAEGDYGFYYNRSAAQFYISGYDGTPYDTTGLTTLIVAARYPLSLRRVTEHTQDLETYGLAQSQDPAWYRLTTFDGTIRRVFVGDMIQTGGGYYCMLDGRDAVYVLDTTLGSVLAPVESYVTPLLSYPVDSTYYYTIDNFTLSVDGEPFISAEYMTDAERAASASISLYRMLVPADYVPSSTNYSNVLKTFCEFTGTSTLAFGKVGGEPLDPILLGRYGLSEPKYTLYYRYSGLDNYIRISERNEDGTYYAYSELFNLLAVVDASKLGFLTWDFIELVDHPIFQRNINDIDSICIESPGSSETFDIKGETETLTVTPEGTGVDLDADALENFRNLYVKLLGLTIEGYTGSTSTDEWAMTMTVVTDVGNEYRYDFYYYSSRRCYFTINGVGEFYCLRDQVDMIIADTQRVVNGEVVSSDKG